MTDSGDNKQDALRSLIHQIDLDEQLRIRGIQQAITEAEAWYWEKRAQQFEDAAPRPGDYMGNATLVQMAEAAKVMKATAQACRNRAQLLRMETDE